MLAGGLSASCGERIGLLDEVGPAADRIAAREQDEAGERKLEWGEAAGKGHVLGEIGGRGAAQPGEGDVRGELAALGLQAEALDDALLGGLEADQGRVV